MENRSGAKVREYWAKTLLILPTAPGFAGRVVTDNNCIARSILGQRAGARASRRFNRALDGRAGDPSRDHRPRRKIQASRESLRQ